MVMRFKLLVLLLFGLILVGCDSYQGSDETEKNHPVLLEAREMVQQQNLAEAQATLEDFLRENPDYALAELQLGMVYQAEAKPIAALYHFQRYLEARPDTPKARILRQVIEDERRRLAEAVKIEAATPADIRAQLMELQGKLDIAQQEVARLELELEQSALRGGAVSATAPPSWAAERLALKQEIARLRSSQGAQVSTTTTAPAEDVVTQPPAASVRTYTVKRGDTLGEIARKVYGRASAWGKIYEANRDVIPNKDVLSTGTVLKIP